MEERENRRLTPEERAAARRRQQRKRQKRLQMIYSIIAAGILCLLVVFVVVSVQRKDKGFVGRIVKVITRDRQEENINEGSVVLNQEGQNDISGDSGAVNSSDGEADADTAVPADITPDTAANGADGQQETDSPSQEAASASDTILLADRKAAQYDYDGAIELLKSLPEYGTDQELQSKVAGYEATKASCVEVAPESVCHVFVHSLIVDTARAFDGDAGQDGYNKNMVTLEEFKKIIQSMYDNGYVLVSLHDMGQIDENGHMQRKSIYLPEGKKPVIFSQDDVSYYHSYENDGFPDKLLIDENGKVKNQYTDAQGNVSIGDYDMVPVLDTFVEEHPDFSYHGMKGIVVLTGYNGVLGYHTDADYRDKLSLQEDQSKWLEAHPEFDFDADVAEATKVADAMKANGWEFASHTWGHISVSDVSLEKLQTDTQKWLDNVSNIVGDTDMIIFAFGADIGDWTGYSSDNAKFNYLKSVGFDYFCNVDGSTLSWVQFGDTYLRTGRMNIDGYRMSSNPDILAPLFDVSQVYDYSRPAMPEW